MGSHATARAKSWACRFRQGPDRIRRSRCLHTPPVSSEALPLKRPQRAKLVPGRAVATPRAQTHSVSFETRHRGNVLAGIAALASAATGQHLAPVVKGLWPVTFTASPAAAEVYKRSTFNGGDSLPVRLTPLVP